MMEVMDADQTLQEILARSDFVGGIDNEALDFSQLEDFINDESDASNTYFADTLAHNEAPRAPHATPVVVVGTPGAPPLGPEGGGSPCHVTKPPQQAYQHPHNLPESPPDSGSEPPYSPQDPAAHSPHGNSVPVHPELLLHPHLYPPSHLKPVINAPGDNLLSHQPVLTPLLTQRNSQPIQQCLPQPQPGQTLQNIGLVSNPNALVLAAAHAGLTGVTDCQSGGITAIYSSLQGGAKKRKLSQDNGQPVIQVKQEPGGELSPDSSSNQTGVLDDDYGFDIPSESGIYLDSSYQCIRFQQFQPSNWHVLCDHNLKELPVPHYRVDADKGFNFSNADDAFVCQKKNHFQITCHAQLQGDAQFVKTPDGLQKVASFHLHFYGVKVESPTQMIKVEQSQSDRSKKPFHPVLCPTVSRVDLAGEQVTKVTVGRLHFSETTSNNMRKKGKPNPDQRYFYLVVGLHAHCADASHYPIVSHASERIIVRASNPGQFESDVELCWQKGHTPESIFHAGRVGINTDRPDEALVIHGNLKVTGHIVQPSDHRAKSEILECDSREQLRNVQQLRVVRYRFAPEFALHSGLNTLGEMDTGLIAQEVQQVIPDAVRPAGDIVLPSGRRIDNFLVVNKDRIFMENVGAVKELCKVTDNLETRIDELERMNKKLAGLKRFDSLKSSHSSYSSMSSKLSSANARPKDSRRHRHKKEDICSNKLIQITVVILVLIMAFCLVAMATLYFLEFQKRSRQDVDFISFSQRLGQARPHPSTQSSYEFDPTDRPMANASRVIALETIATKNNNKPHSNEITHSGWYTRRPPGKPIPSISQGSQERLDPVPTERTEPPSNDDTEPLLPSNGGLRGTSPPVLGRPKSCIHTSGGHYLDNEEHACPTFCCVSDLPHLEDSPDQNPDPAGQTNAVSRSARHFSHPGNEATQTSNTLEEGKQPHILKGRRRRDVDEGSHWSRLLMRHQREVFKSARRRRDSDDWSDSDNIYSNIDATPDADQPGVFVSVRGDGFNRSIGAEFCSNSGSEYGRCVERTAFNYSYSIPLSKYMPDETLILHFHFPRTAQWAEACPPLHPPGECAPLRPRAEPQTGTDWEEPPGTEQPTEWEDPNAKSGQSKPNSSGPEWDETAKTSGTYPVRQPPDGDWEGPGDHGTVFSVEVGALSRSPVRYRVPILQAVNNICLLPKTKLGIEFLEYNFIFYRECDE